MATSGTFYTSVGSYWRLQGEWSASQNISGNYSDVTLKVYWMSTSSAGTTYTSATKSGSATVNGSSSSFTGSAKLSGQEKKLIKTHTVRVNHSSDGTKSISMSAYFDIELTLSGTWYSRVSISDTVTLDTIPRASTLSSDASWYAGGGYVNLSVSRASTSFSHEAEIYVKDTAGTWQWIARCDFSTSQTSRNFYFSTSEMTEIYQRIAGRDSADTRVTLQTFSGSTQIGDNQYYYGTVTAPEASTVDSDTDKHVYVDESKTIIIDSAESEHVHVLKIYAGGTLIKTVADVGSSYTWNPTTTEKNTIYNLMSSSTHLDGEIRVLTFYNGQQIRSETISDYDFYTSGSDSSPTFSSSQISYADIDSSITAITGNNQYIVQNKSNFRAYVNSSATAKNGASIVAYEISVDGNKATISTTGYSTIGVIGASSDTTMTVKAVDSRGYSTTVSIPVKIIPYSPPAVSTSVKRLNGFEEQTTITLSGSLSTLNVGGINKNSLMNARYRYKLKSSSTYGTWYSFGATGFPSYSAPNKTVTLAQLSSWDVQIEVTDKLTVATVTKTVPIGQPIFFMDSTKKSVGVNKFPSNSNSFEVTGDLYLNNTKFKTNSDTSLRVESSYGYIDIAPKNSSYAHVYTDRGSFYFNKGANFQGDLDISGDVNFNNNAIISNKSATDPNNIDHFWHHDAGNEWHFISDGAYKSQGNSTLVAGQIRLTSTSDASETSTTHGITIGHPSSGESMKMDANELSSFNGGSTSHLYLNPSGGDVSIGASAPYGWIFDVDSGRIFADSNKHSNGYNFLGVRDGTVATHDNNYIIQNILTTVTVSSDTRGSKSVSFPVAFDHTPVWILAVGTNSGSYEYNVGVYDYSASGCNLWIRHVREVSTSNSIDVQVVACGQKA